MKPDELKQEEPHEKHNVASEIKKKKIQARILTFSPLALSVYQGCTL